MRYLHASPLTVCFVHLLILLSLSAEEEHCAETLETLKFAGRCSQVETKAKKNVVSVSAGAEEVLMSSSCCRMSGL